MRGHNIFLIPQLKSFSLIPENSLVIKLKNLDGIVLVRGSFLFFFHPETKSYLFSIIMEYSGRISDGSS